MNYKEASTNTSIVGRAFTTKRLHSKGEGIN
jgi:hypothetical protein